MSDPVRFRREEMEIGEGRRLLLYWFEDGLHAPAPDEEGEKLHPPAPSSSSAGTNHPASDEEGEPLP